MNDKNPYEFTEPAADEQRRKQRRKQPLWVKVANVVIVFLLSTPFIWLVINIIRNYLVGRR